MERGDCVMNTERKATIYDLTRLKKAYCKGQVDCDACPLSSFNNKIGKSCQDFIKYRTDEASEIILKWVAEHPQKTYKQDFLEKFPNCLIHSDGSPFACRDKIYKNHICNTHKPCKKCWNEVMPDDT